MSCPVAINKLTCRFLRRTQTTYYQPYLECCLFSKCEVLFNGHSKYELVSLHVM